MGVGGQGGGKSKGTQDVVGLQNQGKDLSSCSDLVGKLRESLGLEVTRAPDL